MDAGEPGLGIFGGSFTKHSNELGQYYSVRWDWRERNGEAELQQLEHIEAFLQSEPRLIDLVGARQMVAVDRLSQDELELLIESAHAAQKLLPQE